MRTPLNDFGLYFLWIFSGLLGVGCTKSDRISTGQNQAFTLASTHTSHEYNIQYWTPDNYHVDSAYRALFLLDGAMYFYESVDLVQKLGMTDVVVVGIGYTGKSQRGQDYAYPKDHKYFPNESGGGKRFIDFLNLELLPFLHQAQHLQCKEKILFGHSLGGYFTLYLLFQQEQHNPFENIIAASPNLLWYDGYLFDLMHTYSQTSRKLFKRLYLTMGDIEGAAMNASFNAFLKQLQAHKHKGLLWDAARLSNTTHRNSPIQSLKQGLSFFL